MSYCCSFRIPSCRSFRFVLDDDVDRFVAFYSEHLKEDVINGQPRGCIAYVDGAQGRVKGKGKGGGGGIRWRCTVYCMS